MGLFDKLFGGKAEAAPTLDEAGRERLIARFHAGEKVHVDSILADLDDDPAFATLWRLLDGAHGSARVDVVDRLAEFGLDEAQQRRLVLASVRHVPGPAWTAVSVGVSCDLGALCAAASQASPLGEEDEAVLAAVAVLLGALCETALSAGPAGDAMDVPDAARHAVGWLSALSAVGARPADLITLRLARALCDHEDMDGEAEAMGWDDEMAERLDLAWDELKAGSPRGGEPWPTRLLEDVAQGPVDVASVDLMAAPMFEVDTSAALLERVQAAPEADDSWTLAMLDTPSRELLDALVPALSADLQGRRLCETDLTSPASQVGCAKCGGPPGAPDEAMMVPKQLEQRSLALLGPISGHPGHYGELLFECLAAPSPSLRFNALVVLSVWPPAAIGAPTWELIEGLSEDSIPQVLEQVELLLDTRPALDAPQSEPIPAA